MAAVEPTKNEGYVHAGYAALPLLESCVTTALILRARECGEHRFTAVEVAPHPPRQESSAHIKPHILLNDGRNNSSAHRPAALAEGKAKTLVHHDGTNQLRITETTQIQIQRERERAQHNQMVIGHEKKKRELSVSVKSGMAREDERTCCLRGHAPRT